MDHPCCLLPRSAGLWNEKKKEKKRADGRVEEEEENRVVYLISHAAGQGQDQSHLPSLFIPRHPQWPLFY